jgi:MFS family permease
MMSQTDQGTTPPTTSELPRNVKVLGATSLVNDIASEMIYPLVPDFLFGVLGGDKRDLGLIEGVSESASSLIKLFSGGWSDRAGRRKGFVLFGYGVTCLTRPVIGLLTAPWQLFLVRIADRAGKGVRTSPRDALIADSTPQQMRGRAFGFHRAMDHLGAAIGPLLAMVFLWLWPGELRWLFFLTVVPGLVVVGLLLFGLRETEAVSPPKERLRLDLRPFGWDFRIYLVALCVFTLGNASDLFLLVRAGELGVAKPLIPLVWAAFHVVKSTGNFLMGPVVDRVGPRWLIVGGWGVYALVYLAFAWATAAWQAWTLFFVYALFYALTEPAEKTLVANLAGRERQGLAFGWFNFALGIMTLPANYLFGELYQQFGARVAFGWGAGLALLAAVILLVAVRRPAQQVTQEAAIPGAGG